MMGEDGSSLRTRVGIGSLMVIVGGKMRVMPRSEDSGSKEDINLTSNTFVNYDSSRQARVCRQ